MSSGQELSVQMFEVKTEAAFKYGFNVSARTIQLVGDVNEDMFMQLDTALSILEEESKAAVTIRINSLGGSVYDGMAIVGRLKASKCKIITEGYGAVMSAAILILACGDKRRMSKFATAMWHEASYEDGGTTSQMKHRNRQMEKEERMACEAMGSFTSSPAAYWANEGKLGKDLYLDADECVTLGVIDEII